MSDLSDLSGMEDEYEDFEFSEEDEDAPDVNLENTYYNSKGLAETDPAAALLDFRSVVAMEQTKGEWGFKALKQILKLHFELDQYDEMIAAYRELLTYIKSAVTRNRSEKCVNSILDFVTASQNPKLLQAFYESTLEALRDARNERLWFNTNLKLGKLWLLRGEYQRLSRILRELYMSCEKEDGSADLKKGTQLLEIYALEIQMYTETKNHKKLKDLYQKSLQIKAAVPHPRIMGIICECGGKMHMRAREWTKAHSDFFEGFKNYDECGNPRRMQCLKYLVLANMLMSSEINPFDSQEAKPYKDDPEIAAMTSLVSAYQRSAIEDFERILNENRRAIMDDPFIRDYIEDLLMNIRTQVLLRLILPYSRIKIEHIARVLNISEEEVENLLVTLILDGRVKGHVDQVRGLLLLRESLGSHSYSVLERLSEQLLAVHQGIASRIV